MLSDLGEPAVRCFGSEACGEPEVGKCLGAHVADRPQSCARLPASHGWTFLRCVAALERGVLGGVIGWVRMGDRLRKCRADSYARRRN